MGKTGILQKYEYKDGGGMNNTQSEWETKTRISGNMTTLKNKEINTRANNIY